MNDKKYILPILISVIIFAIFTTNHFSFSAENTSSVVAPGATLKTQSSYNGTEGPATDADGNVYFSDSGSIYKWTWKDGKTILYQENVAANGMMFDAKGRLVMCELRKGRVTRDDMNGNVTVLADAYEGKKFANPNDLWIDPKGGIYFSVCSMSELKPDFLPGEASGDGEAGRGRAGGGMPDGMPEQGETGEVGIFYISPEGNEITRVADDLKGGVNGLIGTPDGRTIYIGDTSTEKVWSYKINADGTLTDKKLFCDTLLPGMIAKATSSDGMAMDENNNVYIAVHGYATSSKVVLIYSPSGELLEKIDMPQGGASNVEFCGKERKTLFITYGGYIYTLEMAVKGGPTALEQAIMKK